MQRLRRCLPQQRPNEWFRPRSPRSRIIWSSWRLAQPVHPIVKVVASDLTNRNKQITERNTYQMKTSTQTKPSIVFCHGIWADGSCFSKVIPPLQAEGYEVIAAQYGLDTHAGDSRHSETHAGTGQQPRHPCLPLVQRRRHHIC